MTNAKDTILSRIRAAVASSPAKPISAPGYRQSAPADCDLLTDRLRDYGVTVHACAKGGVRQTIEQALTQAGRKRILIAPGFPSELLPGGFQFEIDNGLPYARLSQAEGVLTTCALAIAETGTIFLRHDEAEGRRALTLIPDYHLCIIYTGQVVGTVPEGIRRAAQFANFPITTISGPSATSDIEMTRVKGVHGPRTLDVILAE